MYIFTMHMLIRRMRVDVFIMNLQSNRVALIFMYEHTHARKQTQACIRL